MKVKAISSYHELEVGFRVGAQILLEAVKQIK